MLLKLRVGRCAKYILHSDGNTPRYRYSKKVFVIHLTIFKFGILLSFQLNARADQVAIAPTVTAVAVCTTTAATLLARLVDGTSMPQ